MKIPENMQKCVMFVAIQGTRNKYHLIGTAFKISIAKDGVNFCYIATAKHVLAGAQRSNESIDGTLYLRVNIFGGDYKYIPMPSHCWYSHPDPNQSTDIIVAKSPLPFKYWYEYDVRAINADTFFDNAIQKQENITVGEQIFMIGLFSNFHGEKRNIPIVRCGNLAAMPDERIKTKMFSEIDAYLIELHSLGGLSGSPVFLYSNEVNSKYETKGPFYLLGILHGHWNLADVFQDVLILDEANRHPSINTGIGIVTPASKIKEILIEHPEIQRAQEERIAQYQDSQLPVMD